MIETKKVATPFSKCLVGSLGAFALTQLLCNLACNFEDVCLA